jgi:hypothetical protein
VEYRTVIAAIIPFSATDFTLRVGMPANQQVESAIALLAVFNSFVFDYCARQKIGGTHLSDYVLRQLPVPAPARFREPCMWEIHHSIMPSASEAVGSLESQQSSEQSANSTEASRRAGRASCLYDWLLPRVLELTYTAWDLKGFAEDCGYDGAPFQWNEHRRFLLRCEMDALFFHLYLGSAQEWARQSPALCEAFSAPRDALSYILETFPIFKKRDEKKYDGNYRTKVVIIEIYDEMAEAARTGVPYQTRLNPPPADPSVAHSVKSLVGGVS